MRSLDDLKVCLIAGTLGQGGAERQLYYMLRSLRESGADVTLLTLTQGEHWEAPIKQLGVPIQYLGQSQSRLARCRAIATAVQALKPDIVHSQHFYTNLYAVAAARWTRSREIGSVRSDAVHEVRSHSAMMGNASLRLPRTIAVNSRQGLENAIRLGVQDQKIHLLQNVIDCQQFGNETARSQAGLRVCFVARLTPLKRCDVFLRVLAEARSQTSTPLTATIVGDGPARGELEQLAHQLQLLNGTVRFVGETADPRPYYQAADIVALTSDWEGTPNVILEAMAAGLPVIATDVGGVADLVRHGETGFLSPAGDVHSLAKNLVALTCQPDLRADFGARAKRLVAESHSFDSLSSNLHRVYNAALAK